MKKHIVLIDDNDDIREAIQLLLEDAGYFVTSLSNGTYLNALSKKSLPDLILLDFLLVNTDGAVLCKKLKEQSFTKDIPLILMSAYPNAKRIAEESGINAFIAKPFDNDSLLQLINKVGKFK